MKVFWGCDDYVMCFKILVGFIFDRLCEIMLENILKKVNG